MLIRSWLPRTQLCKKLNAAEPRACRRGCSYPCSARLGLEARAGDAGLLQSGSNLSLGYKTSSHKGVSFFQSAMLWPWQKKDSSFSLPWEVTAGEGTGEYLERKKPLGFLELGYCDAPWSLDGACQGIAEWHHECGQVNVGDPALVGSKLKPPGTFLCHQLIAPTALGHFRGRLGIPLPQGSPLGGGDPIVRGS